jgi:ethanolamine ammonia-lyase large subunit
MIFSAARSGAKYPLGVATTKDHAMSYAEQIGVRTYRFDNLKTLLAKASPLRSGDQLAGVTAATEEERVAAKMALAQVPLRAFRTRATKSRG